MEAGLILGTESIIKKKRGKIQSSGWEIQTKAQADNDEQVLLFL